MLPAELLRARVYKGAILPLFAKKEDVPIVDATISLYQKHLGRKKGELQTRLEGLETSYDYKLVRGLSSVMDRLCRFEVDSTQDPRELRKNVFEEGSRLGVYDDRSREIVQRKMAERLGIRIDELERMMYADLEEELELRELGSADPETIMKEYNLSLLQTLFFKCIRLEFTCSGNWKNIFKTIRRLGLMYSVEKDNAYRVIVDGPISIFKMTDRYGNSFASLLEEIVTSDEWSISAQIISKDRKRIYAFNLKSGIVDLPARTHKIYDSAVEERFASSFCRLTNEWKLVREPEPLIAGRYVMIPDFCFCKGEMKVFLEIIGFWTKEYIEKKLSKLEAVHGVKMIIAADESLSLSKISEMPGVIFYSKAVPVGPIMRMLEEVEREYLSRQAKELDLDKMMIEGDLVTLSEIARKFGTTTEVVREAIKYIRIDDYELVADSLISKKLLDELNSELSGTRSVEEALRIVESKGISDPYAVFRRLGLEIIWESLDVPKSKLIKTG